MIHQTGFKYVPNAIKAANAFQRDIHRLDESRKMITTDRGMQVISQVCEELLYFFGNRD